MARKLEIYNNWQAAYKRATIRKTDLGHLDKPGKVPPLFHSDIKGRKDIFKYHYLKNKILKFNNILILRLGT